MEDEGTKALKRPCEEDLVNSASATTGRKALKRPCEGLVNSASATSGLRRRPFEDNLGWSFVQNPSSASATSGTKAEVTGGSIFKNPRPPVPVDTSAYGYDASCYHSLFYGYDDAAEVWYKNWLKGGGKVKEVTYSPPPVKSGMMPPVNLPMEDIDPDSYFQQLAALGAPVEKRGRTWWAKPRPQFY